RDQPPRRRQRILCPPKLSIEPWGRGLARRLTNRFHARCHSSRDLSSDTNRTQVGRREVRQPARLEARLPKRGEAREWEGNLAAPDRALLRSAATEPREVGGNQLGRVCCARGQANQQVGYCPAKAGPATARSPTLRSCRLWRTQPICDGLDGRYVWPSGCSMGCTWGISMLFARR